MKAPSPEVCMACLKPHRRVDDSTTAEALRARLVGGLAALDAGEDDFWKLAETQQYLKELFRHLIRGKKSSDPDETQANPAPIPPAWWSAAELMEADRWVLEHTRRSDLEVD